MREIRQSGSEGGGNEQTVSPYPYHYLSSFKNKSPTERSPWAFTFTLLFLFLPPTPNPLPSGKRALRFASPGFNFHHFYLLPSIPRLYVTLAEKRSSILILPFTSH